jgi:hypothetical protein
MNYLKILADPRVAEFIGKYPEFAKSLFNVTIRMAKYIPKLLEFAEKVKAKIK